MKKRINSIFVICMVSIITNISCVEDLPTVTDPQQAIMGRWEIIENSFGPKKYLGTYTEFRIDSVVFDFSSEDDFSYSKYWFADSLLNIQHTYINHESGDTILTSILPYKYEFLGYNKLKLDLQYPAIVTAFIYKRIN